jgi:hypothetical protein
VPNANTLTSYPNNALVGFVRAAINFLDKTLNMLN